MSKSPIDPKKVASTTAMGAAVGIGAAKLKAKRDGEKNAMPAPAKASSGAGPASTKASSASGSSPLLLVGFVLFLVGMLAVMLKFG